jgi:predicted dehydrogenase
VALGFAYVGAGFMAQKVHIPNFLALPGVRFLGVAEVRPRLRERVAARFGFPKAYRSHLEIAEDREVDAVGVSAGFAQQGEIARDLLRAGKHVFMEKPMAVSVEQAEAILAAAREGRARLMVAYMKRYDEGNRLAREAVRAWRASGEVGRVTFARAHGFCGDWVNNLETPMETTDEPYPPGPRIRPAWLPEAYLDRYLGYLQQYTHNVNLLRFLLDGAEVGVRAVDLDEDGLRGVAVLEVAGVRATLESGAVQYHGWDEHTHVYFERGWVRVDSPPLMVRNQPARVEVYDGRRRERREIAPPWTWAYRREAEAFVRCLETDQPFDSDGEDALHDVRAFEAIYRAWLTARGALAPGT